MNGAILASTKVKPLEMNGLKAKANELMLYLQNNDLESALRCINEINLINNDHVHSVLGKITRGLHNAISDLSLSSANTQSTKNKTRAGLDYVIEVTSTAAKKTLDMTELTQRHLQTLSDEQPAVDSIISTLKASSTDSSQLHLINKLEEVLANNIKTLDQINKNTTEIVIAQNFQDLASQSITKAINIITDVESTLIALTQHTNLLKQLSLISTSPDLLEMTVAEELRNNLDKIEAPAAEAEHLDQDDVDDLLSSLGF